MRKTQKKVYTSSQLNLTFMFISLAHRDFRSSKDFSTLVKTLIIKNFTKIYLPSNLEYITSRLEQK